jgi:hypothetical protein
MIFKGKKLKPSTYRIVEEDTEEESAGCTQPVRKRSRQVCHLCCAESALN